MDHNKDDIRTLSDPKHAARYILVLLIITIVSVLSLLLAVGAWNRKLYIVAIMLIIQMITLIIVLTLHFGEDRSSISVLLQFGFRYPSPFPLFFS